MSNLEFTAFKVHQGDCFMLKDIIKDFVMVVDGGDRYSNAVENVLAKTKRIDILICTHYDGDHVEGIISLLQEAIYNSDNLVIKEVWLPDFFQRIVVTFSKEPAWLRTNMDNLGQVDLLDHAFLKGIGIKEDLEFIEDLEDLEDLEELEYLEHIEHIEDTEGIGEEKEIDNEAFDLKALVVNYLHRSNRNIDTVVDRIAILMYLCFVFEDYYKGKVRFFEYKDAVLNHKVKDLKVDVIGVNCKEIGRKVRLYNKKDLIYHLTRINIESLVFRYNKISDSNGTLLPNVLFNADSDYSFVKKNKDSINFSGGYNTLVTAPHHGSSSGHENVYSTMRKVTQDFVMVRSDKFNPPLSRPCKDYTNHCINFKRCTICNNAKSEVDGADIVYEYINGSWMTTHPLCGCTYKGQK